MATVHSFPNSRPTPAMADASSLPPIVRGIGEHARLIFAELIRKMFEGADDALFEMGEKARSNEEQRLYLDTMRLLRIEQPRISKSFLEAIGEAPVAPRAADTGTVNIDFEHLSLKPTEALEESIAISNMEAKADGLFRDQIWELDRRLDMLARSQHLPLSPQCLAPAAICGAFRRAVESLNIEFDTKLVIFKLFDRTVVRQLGDFYGQMLAWLDQHGVTPAGSGPTVEASRWSPAGATIDRATLDALRQMGEELPYSAGGGALGAAPAAGRSASSVPGAFSDAALAVELANTLGGASAQAWAQAATQRLALVGRLFADILGDPNVPSALKPTLEQLRFPVIKTALSDPGFFSDAEHPVRKLVHEIATMVAASRAVDADARREVEALVREVREQFDLQAERVQPKLHETGVVGTADIESFLGQIEVQARVRREAILAKVKRIVAEELTLRTVGRDVPAAAWPLLNAGWAPLMCVRLLRYGVRSAPWDQGLRRLEDVLQGMRPAARETEVLETRKSASAALEADLRRIGMADEKCRRLFAGLRQAYAECDAQDADGRRPAPQEASAPGPAPTPVHGAQTAAVPVGESELRRLLELLCTPGAWFRVFDGQQQRTRWLKVSAFHPRRDAIAFAAFDGTEALQLRLRVLVEDLRAGRSEPINPDPFAKTLLERVLRQAAAGS